jgi:hypothetical protein
MGVESVVIIDDQHCIADLFCFTVYPIAICNVSVLNNPSRRGSVWVYTLDGALVGVVVNKIKEK